MERMLAHSSGVIGFPLRLLARENYDRMVAQKGVRNVALITGEEKIVPRRGALVRLHGGGHAARHASRVRCRGRNPALRRPRSRPRLHRPPAARPRPGRNHVSRRRDHPPAAAAPGAASRDRHQAAIVATHLCRSGQAASPAAPHRRGRLQRQRGLRHRRVDPPPSRRLRRGHGAAVAPHAERPGPALSKQGGRLPGRHRRDRDGPQHGCRPCRLRPPVQVRRPAPASPDRPRDRTDRRPGGARHARRHLWHHRRLPAARG